MSALIPISASIAVAVISLIAASPLPTPPDIVTPGPVQPPPGNTGTMALWLGITALVLLSAVGYLILRRRRAAAEAEALDSDTSG